jgi:acyl transferase domain-containing protein
MMQKRLIPKQANFSRPNPKISLSGSDRMVIAQHTQAWAASSPIAVVNNYGAAGSNAAIVIQDHSSKEPGINGAPAVDSLEYPFFISAKSLNSLQTYCGVLKTSLPRIQEQHGNNALASLAYNLARKQNRSLKYSLAFTAADYGELERNLDLASHGSGGIREAYTDRRPVVLCFGGQNGRTVSLDETLFLSSRLLQTHLVRSLQTDPLQVVRIDSDGLTV